MIYTVYICTNKECPNNKNKLELKCLEWNPNKPVLRCPVCGNENFNITIEGTIPKSGRSSLSGKRV